MRSGSGLTPSPVLEAAVSVEVLVSTTNGTTEARAMRLKVRSILMNRTLLV